MLQCWPPVPPAHPVIRWRAADLRRSALSRPESWPVSPSTVIRRVSGRYIRILFCHHSARAHVYIFLCFPILHRRPIQEPGCPGTRGARSQCMRLRLGICMLYACYTRVALEPSTESHETCRRLSSSSSSASGAVRISSCLTGCAWLEILNLNNR
ncbi:hypothetical protein GGR56DRAFT_72296 [Xylariaceae sp. FL0804]|nr:hypothetical protein GGR56DRAFT_72296 [Xylariaceae sp. FL0804]